MLILKDIGRVDIRKKSRPMAPDADLASPASIRQEVERDVKGGGDGIPHRKAEKKIGRDLLRVP